MEADENRFAGSDLEGKQCVIRFKKRYGHWWYPYVDGGDPEMVKRYVTSEKGHLLDVTIYFADQSGISVDHMQEGTIHDIPWDAFEVLTDAEVNEMNRVEEERQKKEGLSSPPRQIPDDGNDLPF